MEKKFDPIKPNILYVDDNEPNLILFKFTFEEYYNIFLAGSGEEALNLLSQNKIAVIISDQRMPGMSGNELLEKVQHIYPEVIRFVLTAYSDYNMVVDSINKGKIYGYFNKPFDTQEILIALKRAIEVFDLRETNKKILKDLEKTNRELREIDKSKTRILTLISNEIRTPINKLMSTIHVLKDKIGTNELMELLNYLDTSVSKLESFSYAANQLAKLNEGIKYLHQKKVIVKELVELCIIENLNSLNEKEIRIEVSDNDKEIIVNGENELLVMSLKSLLVNSMNHTEKNGLIRISIGKNQEGPYIEVTDMGKNYSKKQIEDLATFFSEREVSFDHYGGIDLILAKQVMISNGGKITINQNADKSVTSRMVFPEPVML